VRHIHFLRTFSQTRIQGMNPSGKSSECESQENTKARNKYLFLQDLLFLPGKAVATDLQQIERPLASDSSATPRESGFAGESTFENLSEKDLVFRSRPSVFIPSFPDASLVEGLGEAGWSVHRDDCGQEEGGMEVDRKEGGLSTIQGHMRSFPRSRPHAP